MTYGVGSAPFSANAAWNFPFSQSWMYSLLARFWMFIVIPACLSWDCTAIAWALDVASRSVEVIAVNEKPLASPAFERYDFAWVRLCVGHTLETGVEANGP